MRFFKAPLAVLLCLSLLCPSLPAAGQADQSQRRSTRQGYHSGQLQGDARILHALNRLTFGLRPGDLEVVRSIGLENWFEQQLHPESLDSSYLNARLAQYPAMQLTPEDLLYRFPSNAILRQVMDGKAPMPQNGVPFAIYQNQIDRIAARRAAKADKTNATGAQPVTESAVAESTPGMAMAAPATAPPTDEAAIRAVLLLDPQQRLARLSAMGQPKFDSFFKSLRPAQRLLLVADLDPGQRELVAEILDGGFQDGPRVGVPQLGVETSGQVGRPLERVESHVHSFRSAKAGVRPSAAR